MARDWNQGYVSDIEYTPGFYVEQTPAHLDAVCLLRGMEPPVAPGESFNYCELGCGLGETALAIAAASPDSRVWGFDFNPAHIARAKKLAREGGLENAVMEEASFEELVHGEQWKTLPMFDYITLHGVWSWVSEENRRLIVEFASRFLKPGGVFYVTYNALPGWASAIPLQRMLLMFAASSRDRSDRRVMQALEMTKECSQLGARALPATMMETIFKEKNVSYLSHEYLNEHWSPCFHMDVAADLAAAKLSFVGTANILENFPDVTLTPEQREFVARAEPGQVETLRDYFIDRTFRRDVFVRGPQPIADRRLHFRIGERKLALIVPPKAITRELKVPIGKATLNEGFYEPVLKALSERPMEIGEFFTLPDTAHSTATPREAMGMLIGSRQATLVNSFSEKQLQSVRRYNAAHLEACANEGRAVGALAAAGSGSALTVGLFEMLAYEVLAAGCPVEVQPLTNAIWNLLASRGDRIRHEGVFIEDDNEAIALVRSNAADIISIALPIWQRVGAI